jgi:hypothetical protein
MLIKSIDTNNVLLNDNGLFINFAIVFDPIELGIVEGVLNKSSKFNVIVETMINGVINKVVYLFSDLHPAQFQDFYILEHSSLSGSSEFNDITVKVFEGFDEVKTLLVLQNGIFLLDGQDSRDCRKTSFAKHINDELSFFNIYDAEVYRTADQLPYTFWDQIIRDNRVFYEVNNIRTGHRSIEYDVVLKRKNVTQDVLDDMFMIVRTEYVLDNFDNIGSKFFVDYEKKSFVLGEQKCFCEMKYDFDVVGCVGEKAGTVFVYVHQNYQYITQKILDMQNLVTQIEKILLQIDAERGVGYLTGKIKPEIAAKYSASFNRMFMELKQGLHDIVFYLNCDTKVNLGQLFKHTSLIKDTYEDILIILLRVEKNLQYIEDVVADMSEEDLLTCLEEDIRVSF